MAMAKFFTLQAQAIVAVGRQPAIPRCLEYRTILYKTTFVLDKHVSDKNYELLYNVKAHLA